MGDNIKLDSAQLDLISYAHVFKEINIVANFLSKEGQNLEEGKLNLMEIHDGIIFFRVLWERECKDM